MFHKILLNDIYSVHITVLDFLTLIETGTFLILAPQVWVASKFALKKFGRTELADKLADRKSDFIEFAILTAVALHFGNYFVSAVAKMALGENIFFWMFHNPTEYLMLAALDNGALPISFNSSLVQYAYAQFSLARPVINTLTVLGQFLCVFAILRIDWSIVVTIFFDVMHTAIAILTGIFFWKFIALNAGIVACLAKMKIAPLSYWAKLFLVLCVVLSKQVFETGVFAWLDTRSSNNYRVFAVADSGKEFEIPSNYFLGLSMIFARNRVAWSNAGSFGTETWGTTQSLDIMRAAIDCTLPVMDDAGRPAPLFHSQDAIARILQKHHKVILSMANEDGYVDYDLYPHHIFSVPWKFSDFKQLDKRKIVSYRYKAEAVCLSMADGRLHRDVQSTSSFVGPVTNLPI